MIATETQAREAAQAYRQRNTLGVAPLGDLVALIEHNENVDVAILDGPPDAHGLTAKDPERNAVIVAATRTPNPMRQRSTLAHELGHITFGDHTPENNREWSARSPQEIRADAFARHLLIPLEGLVAHIEAAPDRTMRVEPALLSAIVQEYKVSPHLVVIQLTEAGYITNSEKHRIAGSLTAPMLAARFGWTDQYTTWQEESLRRRAPQKLLARANDAYEQGLLPALFVARLRAISEADLVDQYEKAGVATPPPIVTEDDPDEFLPPGVL
ncbi:MAG: ImmA/IrrE family metallo-endopeptidase [Candidatus Nanopelagicales bacterium]